MRSWKARIRYRCVDSSTPRLARSERYHRSHIRLSASCFSGNLRSTAEQDKTIISNGSSLTLDGVSPAETVKSNGSTLDPLRGNGYDNGDGIGGGGSGDGRGRRGDGDSGSEPDPQAKALLLLLTIVAGSTTLYGIYHLAFAIRQLINQPQKTGQEQPKPEARYTSMNPC